jgi:hypothetical protein
MTTPSRVLVALAIAAASLLAAQVRAAEQQGIDIVQGGRVIQATEASDHVRTFVLNREPFELRVSRTASGNAGKNLGDALFEVCASKERSIFDGIAVGMKVAAMPCLNGAASMARAADESKEAVELMLSNGNGSNVFDGSNSIATPSATIVKIGRITDFIVVGKRCFGVGGKQRCVDQTRDVAFEGDTVYLVVFTDLNGDRVADEGEYTLVKLTLQGPERR